ncbi:MAG TPA: hypothetical protein VGZ22_30665 [Isosphaeraceae bacterium]|jgi:hypothetical protein|nr:hypothetical protein [Isosphaeraceae bacterium]
MTTLTCGWRAILLAVLAALAWPLGRCEAQFAAGGGFSDAFSNNARSGMAVGQLPQQGDWAEIVTVTPKWLVLMNQQGQQFPVSLTNIGVFLMRWPTTIDKIAAGALIEATGIDRGTNQIVTDHMDVYEGGAARQLGVMPVVQTIIGMNRVLSAYDIEQHNTYGVDLFRYLTPDELSMPQRMHVVGPIVDLNPLRLGIPGGNAIAVLPATDAFFMTSITPGSSSFVRKGDLVYFVPESATPKSLNLSQLVVYKKIPQSQFVP